MSLSFELLGNDGLARRGRIVTAHGTIETPAFMPVGTAGTVKAMLPQSVAETGAEIVLEGFIHPDETATEGPYGDHTGYYNEVSEFPVFTVERISMRRDPIYHSTYTGKPPDEPAMLGLALNEVFVPLLRTYTTCLWTSSMYWPFVLKNWAFLSKDFTVIDPRP